MSNEDIKKYPGLSFTRIMVKDCFIVHQAKHFQIEQLQSITHVCSRTCYVCHNLIVKVISARFSGQRLLLLMHFNVASRVNSSILHI